jgi:hypothetical protein
VGAPYDAPVDRWPENPSGWEQAWTRFAAIESPGTIKAVVRERKAPRLKLPAGGLRLRPRGGAPLLAAAEGLLVLGVVLGLIGLFPAYYGSQSLLSQSDQVVAHLCYVIGWAVSAALIALSVGRPATARLGALFGLGLSAVTFGLFLSDLGAVTSGQVSLGLGLVVSLVGWLACTAGSAFALGIKAGPQDQRPGQPTQGQSVLVSRPVRPGWRHAGPLALLVLAAIGTAVAFAPSWDRYTAVATATGASATETLGNAFDNPGVMIAGSVAVMVAIVAVAALAALWRPPRQGALLLAGAIVPLAAQAVSALIQISQPASPSLFGLSAAQASAVGLKISAGLEPVYWVFFVFVISLVVSCAWLFTEPGHPAMPAFPGYGWPPAAPEATAAAEAEAGDAAADAHSDASEEADSDASGEADSAGAAEAGGQSAYA